MSFFPDWWPSIVVVPAVGLVVGALTGVVVGRLGWRVTRSSGASP